MFCRFNELKRGNVTFTLLPGKNLKSTASERSYELEFLKSIEMRHRVKREAEVLDEGDYRAGQRAGLGVSSSSAAEGREADPKSDGYKRRVLTASVS